MAKSVANSINMTYQRRGYNDIQKKWAPIAKEDPIEALLVVEKDLGLLSVVRNYKWNDYWYSKLPTSQVPKNVKNAEIINAILIKSWKLKQAFVLATQTSSLWHLI